MKSRVELQMLVFEIAHSLKIANPNLIRDYYNELMGDTSVILASILEQNLSNDSVGWESDKWMDDSLLTKVNINENTVSIWGIMIWGRRDTTEQYTDPFYFEIKMNNNWTDFVDFTFLFGEEGDHEIAYEDFNHDRNIWDRAFYSTESWNPSERDWKYIFNSKNEV